MDRNRWQLMLVVAVLALLVAGTLRVAGAQSQPEELCQGEFLPVAPPLTELGNDEYVRMEGGPTGFTGGLYPDGANERPPDHEAAGLAASARIQPLNEAGQPDPAGKIVLMSVGMSNTTSEFGAFSNLVHEQRLDNPPLVLVNAAQGGRVSEWWADPDGPVWTEMDGRLRHARVTREQVQVVWIKLTQTRGGDFPAKAQALQADLVRVVQNLKEYLPNLQIAYLSSRTRSYTYWRGLSPEPVAYETGFAVKWLIEAQIEGDPELNFDPAKGEVRAPFLSWGPYLWIDGQNPRADGYTWLAEDMIRDCTHPSRSGNQKVGAMLLDFFQTDTTARSWFLGEPAPAPVSTEAASPTALPSATPTAAPTQTPTATAQPSPEATITPTSTATAIAARPTAELADAVSTATRQAPTPDSAGNDATLSFVLIPTILLILAGAGLGWRAHRARTQR